MNGFLGMGGYALWVWSAYGLTVVVMVLNVVMARNRMRQSQERLRTLVRRPAAGRSVTE